MNGVVASLVGGALLAPAANATLVTLDVSTPSGAAAPDTVLVFDPLDFSPPPGHDSAVIDQLHKQFVPRVTVLRTGTAVTFPNSDQIRHQVYSFSPAKVFNLKLYAGSPKTAVTFDTPGLVVLGCNIHDNMVAFVGVVDTPYFAKTPASGGSTVDLPAGRYTLRVWHPDLAAAVPRREIAVAAAPVNLSLVVQLAAAPAALADWP